MFTFISSITAIGLEKTPSGFKGASVVTRSKNYSILRLFKINPEIDDVKPLYIHHPILTTGLEGTEVLVRSLSLPLTKAKDIEEALAFQVEPLLPYSVDQTLLTYQITNREVEETTLTFLATRKETLQTHLDQWKERLIEPEKVSCIPLALGQFGNHYFPSTKICLILHVQQQTMTCVLLKEGKLWASFAQQEGIEGLYHAQIKDGLTSLPKNEIEWQAWETQKSVHLAEAMLRLQKNIAKLLYALMKEVKGEGIEGIVMTGEVAEWEGLSKRLLQINHFPLLTCEPVASYSAKELLSYAVPIGLAIVSLLNKSHLDFRQQELSYPYPWRRFKQPLAIHFLAVFLLSLSVYFFSQQYLHYQENHLKRSYVDLLTGINKSYAQFEAAFLAKQPYVNKEIISIEQLNQNDLIERLTFLQKELQATPDSFPLFANTPRVSDVLAWLSQHPAVAFVDEQGNRQTRLKIENFNYTMIKRPQHGKKQEKYQVKIELEFSSSMPKWAREFHDALIAPNDWVDSKSEIKWSSNRGKYKTSFFLKDKTFYPSL